MTIIADLVAQLSLDASAFAGGASSAISTANAIEQAMNAVVDAANNMQQAITNAAAAPQNLGSALGTVASNTTAASSGLDSITSSAGPAAQNINNLGQSAQTAGLLLNTVSSNGLAAGTALNNTATASQALNGVLGPITQQLQSMAAILPQLNSALQTTATQVTNLGSQSQNTSNQLQQFQSGLSSVNSLFSQVSGGSGALSGALGTLGGAASTVTSMISRFGTETGLMIAAVTIAAGVVIGLGEAMIEAGAGLQTAEAQLAGFSGMSQQAADTIGSAFVGAFNGAQFSAQAFVSALAPVSAMLENVTGGTISAAQAQDVLANSSQLALITQTGLADATSAVVSVMRTFSAEGTSAAAASTVLFNSMRETGNSADALALVFGRIHDRLGPLAPTLAETGGLLDQLAEHGLTGQRGIQVVQTAIEHLVSPSKEAQQTLKELGVTLFDEQGNFVGFSSAMDQILPALDGLSEKQRIAAEQAIFGSQAWAAMDDVVKDGIDALHNHATAAADSADKQKAAAEQADTLKGQLNELKTNAENAATAIGGPLVLALQALVTWLNNALEKMGNFLQKIGQVAQQIDQLGIKGGGPTDFSKFIVPTDLPEHTQDLSNYGGVWQNTADVIDLATGRIKEGLATYDAATKSSSAASIAFLNNQKEVAVNWAKANDDAAKDATKATDALAHGLPTVAALLEQASRFAAQGNTNAAKDYEQYAENEQKRVELVNQTTTQISELQKKAADYQAKGYTDAAAKINEAITDITNQQMEPAKQAQIAAEEMASADERATQAHKTAATNARDSANEMIAASKDTAKGWTDAAALHQEAAKDFTAGDADAARSAQERAKAAEEAAKQGEQSNKDLEQTHHDMVMAQLDENAALAASYGALMGAIAGGGDTDAARQNIKVLQDQQAEEKKRAEVTQQATDDINKSKLAEIEGNIALSASYAALSAARSGGGDVVGAEAALKALQAQQEQMKAIAKEVGVTIPEALASGVSEGSQTAVDAVNEMLRMGFQTILAEGASLFEQAHQLGIKVPDYLRQGVEEGIPGYNEALKQFIDEQVKQWDAAFGPLLDHVKLQGASIPEFLITGLHEGLPGASAAIQELGNGSQIALEASGAFVLAEAHALGVAIPQALADGVKTGAPGAAAAVESLMKDALSPQLAAATQMGLVEQGRLLAQQAYALGIKIPQNIAAGLEAGAPEAIALATQMIKNVQDVLKFPTEQEHVLTVQIADQEVLIDKIKEGNAANEIREAQLQDQTTYLDRQVAILNDQVKLNQDTAKVQDPYKEQIISLGELQDKVKAYNAAIDESTGAWKMQKSQLDEVSGQLSDIIDQTNQYLAATGQTASTDTALIGLKIRKDQLELAGQDTKEIDKQIQMEQTRLSLARDNADMQNAGRVAQQASNKIQQDNLDIQIRQADSQKIYEGSLNDQMTILQSQEKVYNDELELQNLSLQTQIQQYQVQIDQVKLQEDMAHANDPLLAVAQALLNVEKEHLSTLQAEKAAIDARNAATQATPLTPIGGAGVTGGAVSAPNKLFVPDSLTADAQAQGAKVGDSLTNGVQQGAQQGANKIGTGLSTAVSTATDPSAGIAAKVQSQTNALGGQITENIGTGISSQASKLIDAITGAINTNSIGQAVQGNATAIGTSIPPALAEGIAGNTDPITSALSQVTTPSGSNLSTAHDNTIPIGQNFDQGIADGITANTPIIEQAAAVAIQQAIDAAKASAGISSPSAVAANEIGGPLVQGVAQGIISEQDAIDTALANCMAVALDNAGNVSLWTKAQEAGGTLVGYIGKGFTDHMGDIFAAGAAAGAVSTAGSSAQANASFASTLTPSDQMKVGGPVTLVPTQTPTPVPNAMPTPAPSNTGSANEGTPPIGALLHVAGDINVRNDQDLENMKAMLVQSETAYKSIRLRSLGFPNGSGDGRSPNIAS